MLTATDSPGYAGLRSLPSPTAGWGALPTCTSTRGERLLPIGQCHSSGTRTLLVLAHLALTNHLAAPAPVPKRADYSCSFPRVSVLSLRQRAPVWPRGTDLKGMDPARMLTSVKKAIVSTRGPRGTWASFQHLHILQDTSVRLGEVPPASTSCQLMPLLARTSICGRAPSLPCRMRVRGA